MFHAAALKHVPIVEMNPGEGVLTNVVGTRNVADAAAQHGALAMVQVSTDKAVKPTSVMGASKRLAEFYCQSLDLEGDGGGQPARFMTVRFGNVLGSSGSVVPLFQRQLERGGPLNRHPPRHRALLHDRAGGGGAGPAGDRSRSRSVRGARPDLRPRYGQAGEDRRRRPADDPPGRIASRVDVGVEFTGLRPGEKLYEELFGRQRGPPGGRGRRHPRRRSKSITLEVLQRVFDELAAASRYQDHDTVLRLLAHVVPSYQGGRSRRSRRRPTAIVSLSRLRSGRFWATAPTTGFWPSSRERRAVRPRHPWPRRPSPG